MVARKCFARFGVLAALVLGFIASVANATSPCGRKACSDEVSASGLSGQARQACFKQVIADCNGGACSCTGGSPPPQLRVRRRTLWTVRGLFDVSALRAIRDGRLILSLG
jgi:hypothetical protein